MSSRERPKSTHHVLPWLLAAVFACTTATAWAGDGAPADFKQLQRELHKAYNNADYKKALETAEKMHELRPKHVDTPYNMACLYCLLGHKDKAYASLDEAVKAGYRDAEHLADDDDFKTIRGEDRFRAIVKRLRAGKTAASEKVDKPEKRAKADKPKAKKPARTGQPGEVGKPGEPDKAELKKLVKAKPQKPVKAKPQKIEPTKVEPKEPDEPDKPAEPKKPAKPKRLAKAKPQKAEPTKVEKREKVGKPQKPAKAERPIKPKQPAKPKELAKPEKPAKPDKPEEPDRAELSPEEHYATFRELTQKLVEASIMENREKALDLALEALDHAKAVREQVGERAAPLLAQADYNVACMYSLLDRKDKALNHLDRCIEAGGFPPDMAAQIEGDVDLENTRKDPRYVKIVETARGLRFGPPPVEGEAVDFQWKVTLPKKYDGSKKVPLIVALHPYRGNMETTTDRWKKAANNVGAILLAPQGTYSLGDGLFHWGPNLDTIEGNVLDAIDDILDDYRIDEDKIILTGFSQGGWAAWGLAMRNPDAFRGIIPVGGMFGPAFEVYFEDDDLADLRIFIMLGEDENEQLLDANKHAAQRLKELGAKVKLNVYEGVGHAFPKNAQQEQMKALRFTLQD